MPDMPRQSKRYCSRAVRMYKYQWARTDTSTHHLYYNTYCSRTVRMYKQPRKLTILISPSLIAVGEIQLPCRPLCQQQCMPQDCAALSQTPGRNQRANTKRQLHSKKAIKLNFFEMLGKCFCC